MPEKTGLSDVPWLTVRCSSGCVSNEVSSSLGTVSRWVNVITIEWPNLIAAGHKKNFKKASEATLSYVALC